MSHPFHGKDGVMSSNLIDGSKQNLVNEH